MPWSVDMLVCDVVDGHPRAKEVLESFGLPCWRCVVAWHETLAEGLQPHGIEPSEVIARLEAAAPEGPKAPTSPR